LCQNGAAQRSSHHPAAFCSCTNEDHGPAGLPTAEPVTLGKKPSGRAWYRWLAKNRQEIAAVFASQRRPSWTLLVKTATQIGAVDENGNPPTREGLRKAWERLQRDQPDAALPVKKAARRKSAEILWPVASPPSEVPAAAPVQPTGGDDDPLPRASRNIFKPGRPKF
jgi:hypothetical protein